MSAPGVTAVMVSGRWRPFSSGTVVLCCMCSRTGAENLSSGSKGWRSGFLGSLRNPSGLADGLENIQPEECLGRPERDGVLVVFDGVAVGHDAFDEAVPAGQVLLGAGEECDESTALCQVDDPYGVVHRVEGVGSCELGEGREIHGVLAVVGPFVAEVGEGEERAEFGEELNVRFKVLLVGRFRFLAARWGGYDVVPVQVGVELGFTVCWRHVELRVGGALVVSGEVGADGESVWGLYALSDSTSALGGFDSLRVGCLNVGELYGGYGCVVLLDSVSKMLQEPDGGAVFVGQLVVGAFELSVLVRA